MTIADGDGRKENRQAKFGSRVASRPAPCVPPFGQDWWRLPNPDHEARHDFRTVSLVVPKALGSLSLPSAHPGITNPVHWSIVIESTRIESK